MTWCWSVESLSNHPCVIQPRIRGKHHTWGVPATTLCAALYSEAITTRSACCASCVWPSTSKQSVRRAGLSNAVPWWGKPCAAGCQHRVMTRVASFDGALGGLRGQVCACRAGWDRAWGAGSVSMLERPGLSDAGLGPVPSFLSYPGSALM